MKYSEFQGCMSEIPSEILERYIRAVRVYGSLIRLGYSLNLGWFIYEYDRDGDTLVWSSVLS